MKKEIQLFQVIQVCFVYKKNVNMPKRAVFSIFHFLGISKHALIFYGKNAQISCLNVKKKLKTDANNQMSHSCGHSEPLKTLQNSFFSCVIAFYFSPFFFEHPVLLFQKCPYLVKEGERGKFQKRSLIFYLWQAQEGRSQRN